MKNKRQNLRSWWEFQHIYYYLSSKNVVGKLSNLAVSNTSNLHNSKQYHSQNQKKRQREWIYLSHYLAISGLNPLHVISGNDDGREPDFTLVFYNNGLYYVGIELTTLPKLRDHICKKNLIGQRWYWQSLQQMVAQREKQVSKNLDARTLIESYDRFRLPLKTLYMPKNQFARQPSKQLCIVQNDINEVMIKKSPKVRGYHTRRPLQELWLLIHTNKYQPDGILTISKDQLFHASDFDQVHITRYPSHKVINVVKRKV